MVDEVKHILPLRFFAIPKYNEEENDEVLPEEPGGFRSTSNWGGLLAMHISGFSDRHEPKQSMSKNNFCFLSCKNVWVLSFGDLGGPAFHHIFQPEMIQDILSQKNSNQQLLGTLW